MAISHPLHLDPFLEYPFTWSYFYFPFTPTDLWLLNYFDIYLVVFWLAFVFSALAEGPCTVQRKKSHCHRGNWENDRYLFEDLSHQISANSDQKPGTLVGFNVNLSWAEILTWRRTLGTYKRGNWENDRWLSKHLSHQISVNSTKKPGTLVGSKVKLSPERMFVLRGNQRSCHRGNWENGRYLFEDLSHQISANSAKKPRTLVGSKTNLSLERTLALRGNQRCCHGGNWENGRYPFEDLSH